jgi:hypothetical protein
MSYLDGKKFFDKASPRPSVELWHFLKLKMEAIPKQQRFSSRILHSWQHRQFLLISILLLQFVFILRIADVSLSLAQTPPAQIAGTGYLPEDFGVVIYQSNPDNPRQIYIIGVEHRDTLTRTNGTNTSKVQMEVYKIGEWLIQKRDLELLVPEGFFSKRSAKEGQAAARSTSSKSAGVDYQEIEKKLGDNSVFVNAEMLLKKYYPVRTRQIEDVDHYNSVQKLLRDREASPRSTADLKAELQYLQAKRLAVMLQKIPQVVTEEFESRNIRQEKALFTIGLSHVAHILTYLHTDKIEIPALVSPGCKGETYCADLTLKKENFGVTVIVPKKLADDDAVLKLTRLYKVIQECRNHGLKGSSLAQVLP